MVYLPNNHQLKSCKQTRWRLPLAALLSFLLLLALLLGFFSSTWGVSISSNPHAFTNGSTYQWNTYPWSQFTSGTFYQWLCFTVHSVTAFVLEAFQGAVVFPTQGTTSEEVRRSAHTSSQLLKSELGGFPLSHRSSGSSAP